MNPTDELDLTVIMPTFNRAEIVRKTLESMAAMDTGDLRFEIAVVDNNSTDDTRAVIESFADRLPVHYLFEKQPGKNCALNRGLDGANHGKIVVFTDDDVTAEPDWLTTIVECCARWPEHTVFGGKITVEWPWPEDRVPGWAHHPYIKEFGFTSHDYAEAEKEYEGVRLPFGPNFWARREALEGRRFNVEIGPHPTNRILGDETLFLRELVRDGHAPVYSPYPSVAHRIQEEVLTPEGIVKRSFQLGRGNPHVYGLPRRDLLPAHRLKWRLIRRLAVVRDHWAIFKTRFISDPDTRVVRAVQRTRDLGYNTECLTLERLGMLDVGFDTPKTEATSVERV
ncbi:MAG: glycosyltransferase family 2 protein [Planctomycetes bacterium]|nr:glycosyltransferase family 2 protein [Planctomycetota bacterium]